MNLKLLTVKHPILSKGEVIFEEGENVNGIFCIKGVCKPTKFEHYIVKNKGYQRRITRSTPMIEVMKST
jgi:hypothetical protein